MSDAILTRASATAAASGVGRLAPYGLWIASGLLLVVLPMLFRSGTALTIMSLMGISIIFALSYNMLLGQTGMLSFGHAVYYGLGAYFTVHAINAAVAAKLPIPLSLMPLVGGARRAGLRHAVRLGLDQAQRHRLCHDLARSRPSWSARVR